MLLEILWRIPDSNRWPLACQKEDYYTISNQKITYLFVFQYFKKFYVYLISIKTTYLRANCVQIFFTFD